MTRHVKPMHAATTDDLPYSFDRLDAAMEAAGLDAFVANLIEDFYHLVSGSGDAAVIVVVQTADDVLRPAVSGHLLRGIDKARPGVLF